MTAKGVIIHHSLTKDGLVCDYKSFEKYHKEVMGFNSIGYHAIVERIDDKLITQTGRGLYEKGAHCVGKNDFIGICLAGNFDVAPPDEEALRYLAVVTAGYLRMLELGIDTVHRHSEYAPKSCPGKMFPWLKFLEYVVEAL